MCERVSVCSLDIHINGGPKLDSKRSAGDRWNNYFFPALKSMRWAHYHLGKIVSVNTGPSVLKHLKINTKWSTEYQNNLF